jgi:deoxycytidine triphosphate deaminase
MALSNIDFIENRNRRFVIEPFRHSLLTPTGYDLRFGFGIVLPRNKTNEAGISYVPFSTNPMGNTALTLIVPSMYGALIVTKEKIRLSGRVLGTIHGKSRHSARGLITQSVTVDPNFGVDRNSGQLFLYFFNTAPMPISISSDDPVATLVLSSLDTATDGVPKSKTTY